MPHVLMKLWLGKSEQERVRLAEKIAKDVMGVLNYGEEFVSVSIEEVAPEDWAGKVYKPKSPTVRASSTRSRDTRCDLLPTATRVNAAQASSTVASSRRWPGRACR